MQNAALMEHAYFANASLFVTRMGDIGSILTSFNIGINAPSKSRQNLLLVARNFCNLINGKYR